MAVATWTQEETKKLVSQLYEDRAGYGIDTHEEKLVTDHGSSPTYGEITPEGVDILVQELDVTKDDVFYDLGCGVGKFVLQMYLETPARKSVGVELAPTRIRYAQKVKDKLAEHKRILPDKEIHFKEENMLDTPLEDATIIYVSSTCFSNDFMKKVVEKLAQLKPGLRLITLTQLPENEHFERVKELTIPMTWSSSTTAYIHKLKDTKAHDLKNNIKQSPNAV